MCQWKEGTHSLSRVTKSSLGEDIDVETASIVNGYSNDKSQVDGVCYEVLICQSGAEKTDRSVQHVKCQP